MGDRSPEQVVCPSCGAVCHVRRRAHVDVRSIDDVTYVLRFARRPWPRRHILHECLTPRGGPPVEDAGVPARPSPPTPTLQGAVALDVPRGTDPVGWRGESPERSSERHDR